MQDGDAIPADAAGEWLKKHIVDDPETRIDITWHPADRDDAAYRKLLRILFATRPGDLAA
ncbi:hypothetical protein [Streptomyces demainii]|uniref:Uncharacterized protein n=1 Tax=Streptomyces demainii TaxID=588122 RepID=A0ABT9KT24_9ACTN|nr:hypothetical protein [Streptomyces demainii]MDP9611576.1 hypothetical protein [Streptomyces demainii]